MALPQLADIAEIGWSPPAPRACAGYRQSLAAQGLRWSTMGPELHIPAEVGWAG